MTMERLDPPLTWFAAPARSAERLLPAIPVVPAPSRGYRAVKRAVDVVLALVLGAVTLPLVPLIALAITLDSPGAPFYRQVRTGLGGRPFHIYKFRSMVADAERPGRPVWSEQGDPRVTAVGHLLRRSRLDEMPQLWNILRGEMTFVGPRPERPELVLALEVACPGFARRVAVKPGLTGWAQVRHTYTSSVAEAAVKLEYDLYYIRHAGLLLDAEILVRTVGVVLGRKGR
ncbi:sugar transferase [Georgenia faecalis]|uniref:Sugar transferase n=1 Tax=Georgenia faecalis TaxID=2483799 RepID=A0ABV9D4U2_9MICO|nr:sugar transferase [Georgenia faecalis]